MDCARRRFFAFFFLIFPINSRASARTEHYYLGVDIINLGRINGAVYRTVGQRRWHRDSRTDDGAAWAIPLEDVFPRTPIVVADLAGGTLGRLDDMQHLRWQFVRVYHYVERPGIYIYWKCNFCYSWSYIFDQDIMHTHLLCQCEQVCSEH